MRLFAPLMVVLSPQLRPMLLECWVGHVDDLFAPRSKPEPARHRPYNLRSVRSSQLIFRHPSPSDLWLPFLPNHTSTSFRPLSSMPNSFSRLSPKACCGSKFGHKHPSVLERPHIYSLMRQSVACCRAGASVRSQFRCRLIFTLT